MRCTLDREAPLHARPQCSLRTPSTYTSRYVKQRHVVTVRPFGSIHDIVRLTHGFTAIALPAEAAS